jgi:phage protein D
VYNYLSIEFPLAQNAPKRTSAFVLKQARFAHEIATARFKDWDVQYVNVKPGDPVKCVLRGRDTSREFVGYIHDIKPEISPTARFVTVTIIGASYQLKQARQRVFENVTAPDVVRIIAREHNFAVDIEEHPRVYPQVVQAGISDFQLLARLAQQCGYLFRVDNTTIKFKKTTTDYNANRANAQNFEMNEAGNPAGYTMYSFNLILGESNRYSDAYKSAVQVGGVDPTTQVVSLVTNQVKAKAIRSKAETEFFDSYATDTVAPDTQSAYYESVSADERNRFPYRAHVQVLGTPNLAPGMPVFLSKIGPEYSGYWIVLSTEHHIVEVKPNVLQYTTYLQVGSDSIGDANVLNGVNILKPETIKKRALVPGVRNNPPSNKSKLKKGTGEYVNHLSQITNRPKGTKYNNQVAHIWIFDGQTTKEYVTPSSKTAYTRSRSGK